MEIELRAKIENKEQLIISIQKLGFELINTKVQNDIYFKHKNEPESMVIRFRVVDKKEILTFKHSKNKTDVGWDEWEIPIQNGDYLQQMLLNNNYEQIIRINKKRIMFKKNDIIFNIDEIENKGIFVEAEIISENLQTSVQKLRHLFESLKITEIIEKGYVKYFLGDEKNGK